MPKNKTQTVRTKSTNTVKMKRIEIKLSLREFKQLESLVALTGFDISKLVRACIKQSAGAVRQGYIKGFVGDALAMEDPFGEPGHVHSQQYAEASINDSDRQLAEKYEAIANCAYERGYDAAHRDLEEEHMLRSPGQQIFYALDKLK